MVSIVPDPAECVFDPETTKAMGEAFDSACEGVALQPALRELMAMRIVQVAQGGERDVERLRARARDALSVMRR
ncbi:MAG: hypothetical protein IT536_04220 [Hyphomicrobiales bacterium]|nr:hypothetical protein [Hyphomicrobiales bacterium]